jgi:hypothetical protein
MGGNAMGAGIPYSDPKNWQDWQTYRQTVQHPVSLFRAEDLERARRNIAQFKWAQVARDALVASGDRLAPEITDEWVQTMLEVTTAGCMGPCPACRALGKRWHPNGQWSWTPRRPNQLKCRACGTVYPNDKYPESIKVQSTWDPRQTFTFIDGDTFVCFSYKRARSSPAGIIRAKKVSHVGSVLLALGKAYALTGDAKYAQAARRIYLRLVEVFPTWLVRAGYGYNEYADCPPHTAAERILNLPNDELVCPPNQPDRKVHTGYWSASRVGTAGMDGGWVIRVAVAYDLMCEAQAGGTPVFSAEERERIERDVLLESTYLAACDTSINNKSVGNRAGAAIVGLVVGHPGLVRFGLDGFVRTVDDWFLPDGGTSESAAYAMMTMSGIRAFAEAFRDYTEPTGYVGPDGKRLEHFNVCRDTVYGTCWQGLYWKLQGNRRFPPIADSYRTSSISSDFAELVALAYPTPQHLAYLKEVAGVAPTGRAAATALFYRDAAALQQELPRFSVPDVVFPYLAQGYLRRGVNGRQGTVVLNASDWGGHHHYDGLGLYLWQGGHELLSDLGYLWDHPDKAKTYRTFAHNLAMVDGKRQERQRGGSFHLFHGDGPVRFMEASAHPYPNAKVYRRTVIQIDHGQAGAYVLDLFRVQGGTERQYLFHGPLPTCETEGISLATVETPYDLANPKGGTPTQTWQARWTFDDGSHFAAFSPAHAGETVVIGDGWGQRDHRNSDRGATLPYLIRARSGDQLDAFATVFSWGPKGTSLVQNVSLLHDDGETVVAAIKTTRGTDVVVSMLRPHRQTFTIDGQEATTDARLAVLQRDGERTTTACCAEATILEADFGRVEALAANQQGTLRGTGGDAGESYFLLDPPPTRPTPGSTLFVTGKDSIQRAYPVRRSELVDGALRVYTRTDNAGFPARPAETWHLPAFIQWRKR